MGPRKKLPLCGAVWLCLSLRLQSSVRCGWALMVSASGFQWGASPLPCYVWDRLGRWAQAVGKAGQASQLSLAQKSTLLLWGVGEEARENTPREVVPYLAGKGGFCAMASDKLAGPVMTCSQSTWQWSHLVFIASLASFLLPFLQQPD